MFTKRLEEIGHGVAHAAEQPGMIRSLVRMSVEPVDRYVEDSRAESLRNHLRDQGEFGLTRIVGIAGSGQRRLSLSGIGICGKDGMNSSQSAVSGALPRRR